MQKQAHEIIEVIYGQIIVIIEAILLFACLKVFGPFLTIVEL